MKLRIRQSLISSWQHAQEDEGTEHWEEFLNELRGGSKETNKYMQAGIDYENAVYAAMAGQLPDKRDKEYPVIIQMAHDLYGAALQVHLFKTIVVDDQEFLLDGTPDAIKEGVIYDVKRVAKYDAYGRYFHSPQHPMYFKLVPGAKKFVYKICDGKYIFEETYWPDETEPIESIIRGFVGFLKAAGLMDDYIEHWRVKE